MHSNESDLFRTVPNRIADSNSGIHGKEETEGVRPPRAAFMNRIMMQIGVMVTEDKYIELVQDPEDGGTMQKIILSPDQIDTLINWLMEAYKEAID